MISRTPEYEKSRFMDSNKVNRQQNNKMTDTRVLSAQINYTTVALALCGLIFLFYRPDLVGEVSAGDAVTFLALASAKKVTASPALTSPTKSGR